MIGARKFGLTGLAGLGLGLGRPAKSGGGIVPPEPVFGPFASFVGEGDSITFGLNSSSNPQRWTSLLAAAWGASELNKGISGTVLQNSNYDNSQPRTNNGRDRFIADMTGTNKRALGIIAFGTNDARFLAYPSTFNVSAYANDMGEMISGLMVNGYAPAEILVLPPYWLPDNANFGSGGTRTTYETYVTAAKNVAREYGVAFVNIYTYMRDNGGSALISNDDLHPNDAGHAVIAQGVRTASVLNTRAAPSGLTVSSPGAGQMAASWTAPAGAVVDYTVQYGIDGSFAFTVSKSVAGTSTTWDSLAAASYRVRVRANFADGSSRWVIAGTAQSVSAGSGPVIFLQDSFTDADGTNITAHTGETGATWSAITGYSPATPSKIQNNRLWTASNQGGYRASGTPPSPDYYVEVPITFLSTVSADGLGVAGRISGSANTMYFGRYGVTAGGWQLFKVVAGTTTQMGSTATAAAPTGTRTLRLVMNGTAISLRVDGVEVLAVTDSAITAAGFAGFRGSTTVTATTGQHADSITASATL